MHLAGVRGSEHVFSDGTRVPYLCARDLSKSFGHVRALHKVDLDVCEHEVLAIVGDNGAGKSTLTKILSGVVQPDHGEIVVRGKRIEITDPRRAHEIGISTVFQTLALVPCRDVACNLFLGREPTFWGMFVDRRKMLKDSRAALSQLGIHIPSLSTEVGELSGGQRQSIAIARAISRDCRILIMDEPTAALGVKESGRVLDLITRLREAGTAIIVISHNMLHVFSVADWIMVLRRGELVGIRRKRETSPDEIVSLIVGSDNLHGDKHQRF